MYICCHLDIFFMKTLLISATQYRTAFCKAAKEQGCKADCPAADETCHPLKKHLAHEIKYLTTSNCRTNKILQSKKKARFYLSPQTFTQCCEKKTQL